MFEVWMNNLKLHEGVSELKRLETPDLVRPQSAVQSYSIPK